MNKDDLVEVFQRWEQDLFRTQDKLWDSMTADQQLLLFCKVVRKLVQSELVDQRSYRGVLYDEFGFGLESYVQAQVSGFLTLHNAIDIVKN
jgi:hypothetical protein